MDKKVENSYSRALIAPNSWDKATKTFEVVFATETPVFRHGWEENFNEVLVCSKEAVRSARFVRGLPLFDNHPWDKSATDKGNGGMQLGKVTDIRFEKGELIGKVTLGARADEALISDIENGIVDGISVGYNVYKFEREPMAKDQEIPTYRAIDWEPFEVSFAPVQADFNSNIRSKEQNLVIINKREIMAETTEATTVVEEEVQETTATTTTETTETVEEVKEVVDVEDVRKQATQAQKRRLDDITKSTRAAGIEDAKAIEYFNSEKSIEEIRQAVIEEFVKTDPKMTNIATGKEAIEKKREAAEAAILGKVNPSFDKENKGGEYRSMSLLEIGKELLTERGVNVRSMDKNEVSRTILGASRDMSTSDFPLLLGSLLNKMLRADYTYAEEYWNKIARQESVNDFKAKNLYQVGSANNMQETPEGDEVKYGKLLESKQTLKVKSYSEGLLFTRQMLINDDLSAFSKIASKFALDWETTKGDIVWSLITSNVTMDDNKALFHTDHANLASSGAVLSDVTLEAALLAMKKQKGLGNRALRIAPKLLIVSPDYEITARKLLTIITPTATDDVNVFISYGLTIIVEPRLSGKAWYLAADPQATEGLVYAYLDGQGGLRSNREDSFDTDSVKFAVRGEFGAAAIDYRGWYKNAGE